jgi:hypothetical protein
VRHGWAWVGLLALAAVIVGSQAPERKSQPEHGGDLESNERGITAQSRLRWTDDARSKALQQAVLWHPTIATGRKIEGLASSLVCRFKPDVLGGTSPKFECTTDEGQTIKVKYGGAEPHGEVAATRLMRAVGFAADDVRFVERVRCHGCPTFPFLTMRLIGFVRATAWYGRIVDYSQYRDISWAAVERKHPGTEIETADGRGWGWYELDAVQAPRAHVDGLRLIAMFLAHWDNKSENQRLVCLDDKASVLARGRCLESLALVQDLGATFGPRKVDLGAWRRSRIWTNRASCLVSMENMPHGGATFRPVRISEEGRRFLAGRLEALTRAEIRGLFEGARFPQRDGQEVDAWVQVFEDKVREISAGQPCPRR